MAANATASVRMFHKSSLGRGRSLLKHGGANGNRVIASSSRWQHSKSNFSSYEYPLRNEAPVVTKTTAAQAAAASSTAEEAPKPPLIATRNKQEEDRFDDDGQMSHLEAMSRRQQQKQWLTTSLVHKQPIEPQPPKSIPPNVASTELEVPRTEISVLPNGIRVASQETYGQVTTVGVVSDVGSRHEKHTGVTHLLELLAFRSTKSYKSAVDIFEALQDWGGVSFCNTNREQTLHCIDVLRPNTKKAMSLLQEVLLEPKYLPEEVEDCKRAVEFQTMDVMPEVLLGEALNRAAYGPDQQLGQPHFCPLEALDKLTVDTVRDQSQLIANNPSGMVVAGAGIGHDELRDMAEEHFGHLSSANNNIPQTIASTYKGGQHTVQHQSRMDNFTRIAIGMEVGGWHSDDLVPTCVLQTLLGGGNSFSAGGPGKGMYSRLYRQVLNRYSWAESAEAFTSFHNESGLWGMSASCEAGRIGDVSRVLMDHFCTLAFDKVSDEELSRARNMLKCNVLTQLESRLVLFEDLGRQVLTYGHREETQEMCDRIDAVTADDLLELARKALSKLPTVAAVGPDVHTNSIPTPQEMQQWTGI